MHKGRLSKEELIETYTDPVWLDRLLSLNSIVAFYEECVLHPQYKIPDDLNGAIHLTSMGNRVLRELITKHQVPAKEARVLCFLTMVHTDPLIDVEATDLEVIIKSCGRQIADGDLKLPYIYGRNTYDRAATLFEDERSSISYEDSLRLLDGAPQGVFQQERFVSGPYGLLQSRANRWIAPTLRVPMFHCADISCKVIHRAHLASNTSAPINESRHKIYPILESINPDPSAWGALLRQHAGIDDLSYLDNSMSTLPYLLGDAFSHHELQDLLAGLLDKTKGRLREDLSGLGMSGSAVKIVQDLGVAETLQLILLATDVEISENLDRLVDEDIIKVPAGETRRPVVNNARRSGSFELQVQLGPRGVRVQSASEGVAPLRLRRLVDKLYKFDEQAELDELHWQLRGVEASTLEARLDDFVRTETPEAVIRRLVLARRANLVQACKDLGITIGTERDDHELTQTILWKLGFNVNAALDSSSRFWQLHERMKQITHTAGVSAIVDQEAVRALASNYFVELEYALDDSLAFTTWALTSDHATEKSGFAYRPTVDRVTALARLDAFEQLRDSGPESLRFGETSSLYTLCRGFGSLANMLSDMAANSGEYRRPEADIPRYANATDLKVFPFRHLHAFLDLTSKAQSGIIEGLRSISSGLVAADVNGVRNDQLHFRRSTADLGRLAAGLSAVDAGMSSLENLGFTRILFHPTTEQGDEWGRRICLLQDSRGREIAFARPSSSDWLRMPSLRSPQYLMTAAVFTDPNEVMRFSLRAESEFSRIYEDFPARRSAPSGMKSAKTAG